MNGKQSIKEILNGKKSNQEAVIQALGEAEVIIWIRPEQYEIADGIWIQPDMAMIRNKEKVIEDIERSASSCLAKYYLGFQGRRVSGSLRDQDCSTSDLFVDYQVLSQVKVDQNHLGPDRKLFANHDCSYIRIDGQGYILDGAVRRCVLLFVTKWTKGIRELPSCDILSELDLEKNFCPKKLFRGYKNRELFNHLFKKRHGYYALSISEIERIADDSVLGPMFVQTQSTLNQ